MICPFILYVTFTSIQPFLTFTDSVALFTDWMNLLLILMATNFTSQNRPLIWMVFTSVRYQISMEVLQVSCMSTIRQVSHLNILMCIVTHSFVVFFSYLIDNNKDLNSDSVLWPCYLKQHKLFHRWHWQYKEHFCPVF